MLTKRISVSQVQTCYRLDPDGSVIYEGESGDRVMFIPEVGKPAALGLASKGHH